MRYSEINLKEILREEILRVISNEVLDKPTASEKKEIQKKIEESVSSSDYRSAINSLILGISFDSSKTFYNLRKKDSSGIPNIYLKNVSFIV